MNFETQLIKCSKLKQRMLMRPATIASDKPDTGVTIINKSAYFVIRDCADITRKYLALMCYGGFTDPLKQLKGKFKKIDIIDFVARAHDQSNNTQARQLLCAIVADINKSECKPRSTVVSTVAPQQTPDFAAIEDQTDDIYGDYEYMDEPRAAPVVETESDDSQDWLTVDLADDDVLTERLIKAFAAK